MGSPLGMCVGAWPEFEVFFFLSSGRSSFPEGWIGG